MQKKQTYEELEQRVKELENEALERKRVEEALRESEQQYRTLGETIPYGVWLTDATGYCTYVSNSFLELVDMSLEQIQKFGWLHLLPPEAMEPTKEHWLHCVETGEGFEREHQFRANDGNYQNILAIGRPIKNDAGKIVKWVGLNLDVTERKQAEEALRESEKRYRSLFEESPVSLWEEDFSDVKIYIEGLRDSGVEDLRGYFINHPETVARCVNMVKLIDVNKATLEMYDAESIAEFRDNIGSVFGEESYDVFIEALNVLAEGETIFEGEATTQTLKGDKNNIVLKWSVAPDYEETWSKVLVAISDITDRKRAEEALRENEEKLRAITDTALDSIFCKDMTRRYTFANSATLQLMGCAEADLIGKVPEEVFDKENAVIVNEVDERTLNSEDVNEIMSLSIAGRTHTLQTIQVPLRDSDGNITGISGIVRDMTDFVQAQEALRESEEKYRKLVEEINDVLYSTDKTGVLTYVSPSIKSVSGYEVSELIGRSFTEIIHPDDMPRIVKRFKEVLSDILEPLEYRLVTKSGEVRWIRTSSRPVFKDNLVTGVRGMLTDITESKRLQAQLQQAEKMEAIGTLTGGIAHDYNNLMSIIMGNLSLAQEEAKPGSVLAGFLNEANMASRKVRDLTHELMSLSRGGGPVREVGSLDEVLKSVSDIIPADSGISLTESISQDLKLVPYDRLKMNAAIRNVVENAVEAMPDGGTLKITAENLRVEDAKQDSGLILKPGDFVHISIQDQGDGILEEHMDKIFDPYFSTKTMGVQKGMGLGLATAYAIIKQHGGHIQIDSSLGAGTTVNIYLPAESHPEQMDSTITSTDDKTSPAKRVLFMDDEKDLRNLSQKMLEPLGYKVVTVKDGVEAIETYKKNMASAEPFDAVILDLTIKGGMGGEETMRELLKIDPDVKAIVSSGYFNDPAMSDFEKYGFMGALAKPYEKRALKEVLERLSE